MSLTGVYVQHPPWAHGDLLAIDVVEAFAAVARDELMEVVRVSAAQVRVLSAPQYLAATDHFNREEWMWSWPERSDDRFLVRFGVRAVHRHVPILGTYV
ncbi:MAG: hypothetical protein WBM50_21765 [Acidimicrobiales bacterium]